MPKKRKKLRQDPSHLVSSLSKNVLGLKFMQRAQKAIQRDPVDLSYEDYEDDDDDDEEDDDEEEEKEHEQRQRHRQRTVQAARDISLDKAAIQNIKSKRKCIIHPSYQFCEKYKFGRLSFKGMNMDIETMMQNNRDFDLSLTGVGSASVRHRRPADESWDDIIHD